MLIGDKIAIGIVVFCIAVAVLGSFKFLLKLIVAASVSLVVLVCFGVLSKNIQPKQIEHRIVQYKELPRHLEDKLKSLPNLPSPSVDTARIVLKDITAANVKDNSLVLSQVVHDLSKICNASVDTQKSMLSVDLNKNNKTPLKLESEVKNHVSK